MNDLEHKHEWQEVFMYKFCKCGKSELTEAGKQYKEARSKEFADLWS